METACQRRRPMAKFRSDQFATGNAENYPRDPLSGPLTFPAMEFTASMRSWVTARLAELGMTVTGPEELRIRAWSVIAAVPTSGGKVWFKANPPDSVFEPRLTWALRDWAPGSALVPLAVDTDRGWSLLPDGGPTLRELLGGTSSREHWPGLLADYVRVQRALAGRVADLFAMGITDFRPPVVPGVFEHLLELAEPMLPMETLVELSAARSRIDQWCGVLADSGVPATLDHADVYEANVFPSPSGSRFFDWGDSVVGHPFCSLMSIVCSSTDADPDWLCAQYLAPWRDGYADADLWRWAEAALPLGFLTRALAFTRSFPGLPAAELSRMRGYGAETLTQILQPSLIRRRSVDR
ncbi:hypothetical protein D5S17_12725 [Pseudonocardiaceae bacterium YIM PH 21723]|nr:hypothetical protein D5S17_12725 [Pseudonocardiaceae bacterium YIM PH 21723]